MVKKATAVVVMAVLSLATGCSASAPTRTPTPEPTLTPVWVLATKPEHLAGVWFNARGEVFAGEGEYYRFETAGSIKAAATLQQLQENPYIQGTFWFEDGVYYEEGQLCLPIGSYRAYLDIEEGRAIRLRFEEIDDSDRSCYERSYARRMTYVRVD
jgi:hypothetical protein